MRLSICCTVFSNILQFIYSEGDWMLSDKKKKPRRSDELETDLFCELAKKAYLLIYLSIGCEEDDRRFDSDKSCLYRNFRHNAFAKILTNFFFCLKELKFRQRGYKRLNFYCQ